MSTPNHSVEVDVGRIQGNSMDKMTQEEKTQIVTLSPALTAAPGHSVPEGGREAWMAVAGGYFVPHYPQRCCR